MQSQLLINLTSCLDPQNEISFQGSDSSNWIPHATSLYICVLNRRLIKTQEAFTADSGTNQKQKMIFTTSSELKPMMGSAHLHELSSGIDYAAPPTCASSLWSTCGSMCLCAATRIVLEGNARIRGPTSRSLSSLLLLFTLLPPSDLSDSSIPLAWASSFLQLPPSLSPWRRKDPNIAQRDEQVFLKFNIKQNFIAD